MSTPVFANVYNLLQGFLEKWPVSVCPYGIFDKKKISIDKMQNLVQGTYRFYFRMLANSS